MNGTFELARDASGAVLAVGVRGVPHAYAGAMPQLVGDLLDALAALEGGRDALETALRTLVDKADDSTWHLSEDCRVEGYADQCGLCQALAAARAVLKEAPDAH